MGIGNFSSFRKKWDKYHILIFSPPKGTSLCRTASFDVLSVKISAGVLAVGDWKNQK